MHKISNRIFEIFFKKTLDFLLAGFRFLYNLYKKYIKKNIHFMIVVIDCHLSVTSYSPRTIYSADYIMISFKMNIII